MAEKQLKTRVALRRDLKANFNPALVPLKGELLFVQQEDGSLRLKVGDGSKQFYSLPYLDEENNIVVWGYYLNGKFYTSSTYTTEVEKSKAHIYIDSIEEKVYIYDGSKYVCVDSDIPNASAQQAGIMKLYSSQGQNTDGTITQKFFTDSIDDILFSVDEEDAECLVLDKPW